jgi:MFS family permease
VFPHRHGGLQGFAGGVLIPLAFTIVMTMLPPTARAGSKIDLRHSLWQLQG